MPQKKVFSMIILAGGKSSRMGTDKADLLWKGMTFLQTQIHKGVQLGIEDIQVSGYRGEQCPIPVTKDRVPEKGPLGGLESCLRNAKYEKCLVLSVDVPLVPVCELEKLLEAGCNSSAPVTVLKHGEKTQPLIAVYDRSLADAMLEEITWHQGSVFALLNKIGYDVYESSAPSEVFLNVNTLNEYINIDIEKCIFL